MLCANKSEICNRTTPPCHKFIRRGGIANRVLDFVEEAIGAARAPAPRGLRGEIVTSDLCCEPQTTSTRGFKH